MVTIADAERAFMASKAIRDILFLFRDLVACQDIVGDHDTGTFDAWKWLRCDAEG